MAEFCDLSIVDDDLEFLNGDIRVLPSDQQHVEHIIKADKGHYRQHPLIGVGIRKNLAGGIDAQELRQEIKLQLRSDNYAVSQLLITDDFKISIAGQRIK